MGHLFPQQIIYMVGWDWFQVASRLQEIQPDQFLRKHPNYRNRANSLHVGQIDQIDHDLLADHLDRNLPLCDSVQDIYSTDPT